MTAVVAVILTAAGFIFGWIMADDLGWIQVSSERTEETTEETSPTTPPARDLSLPTEDVAGADITGLPRYPGSVRIEYIREDQGEIIWTETEYLTDASLEETREFYRDSFRSEGWSVNDVGFTQNSWVFFVVDGEREVFVNLRPRGSIVEVDIEQTEPDAEEKTEPNQNVPRGANGDENAGATETPQGAEQATPYYGDGDDLDDDYEDDLEDDYDDDLYDD